MAVTHYFGKIIVQAITMTKTLSDSSVFVAYQRQAESGTSSNEEENPVHTKLKPKPRKKNRKKKARSC